MSGNDLLAERIKRRRRDSRFMQRLARLLSENSPALKALKRRDAAR
jgi:hypothetical protein